MAVGRGFWQQVGAAGFFQGQVNRDGLGLVVLLLGQPAPGQYGARADTADQRGRAIQFAQAGLQRAALLQAVLGQNHLNDLRRGAAAQGAQLVVGQLLVVIDRYQHLSLGLGAGNDAGHDRAVGGSQRLQSRLRCRAFEVPVTAAGNHGQHDQCGQDVLQGALNHQRFTNPVKPPAIRAAVSASATSGSSPAGTAI